MNLSTYFIEYGGLVMAILGMGLAVLLPGIGSGKAVGMIGEAASILLEKEPEKFGKSLILQLMGASQGLYGFVIAIMVMGRLSTGMSLQEGMFLFAACLPMALVGYPTAVSQGKLAISGVHILIKNESQMMKVIIYTVMVETYALLGLVTSLIMLNAVTF